MAPVRLAPILRTLPGVGAAADLAGESPRASSNGLLKLEISNILMLLALARFAYPRKLLMPVLGLLTSVALLVGSVQTTMVMPENDRLAAEQARPPVVELQSTEVQGP